MREAGIAFTVMPSSALELSPGALEPVALCMENAKRKAADVADAHPDSLVIGCDTIVCLDNLVFGKPKDYETAVTFLSRLQGQRHTVMSGLSLISRDKHVDRSMAESTDVTFKPMTERQIRNYLQLIDPLDKAGGYAAQEHRDHIIDRVDGSFANVMGLPIERLQQELQWLFTKFKDEKAE